MRKLFDGGNFALGFILGLLLFVPVIVSFKFANLPLFEDTAFGGAILGAIIAGLIGVAGQILVIVQNNNANEAQRSLQNQADLTIVFIKLGQWISVLSKTRLHILSSDPFDNINIENRPPLMTPLIVNDFPDNFDVQEMAVVLGLKRADLFDRLYVGNGIFSNFTWAMEAYRQKIDEIRYKAGRGRMEKGVIERLYIERELTQEQYYELKDLQDNIVQDAFHGLAVAISAASRINGVLRTNFGVEITYKSPLTDSEYQDLLDSIDFEVAA